MQITITTPYRSASFDLPTDMVMQIMMECVEATLGVGKAPGIKPEERPAETAEKEWQKEPEAPPVDEAPMERLMKPENVVNATGETRKPFVFRPGSRNEHIFGKDARYGVKVETPDEPEGYKGFLMIKCEHCGEVRGMCAKYPMTEFRCKSCGETTPLHDLKPVYLNCKCGKSFKYRTNRDEDQFEWECIDCGANVDLVYNSRKDVYQSL